MIKRKNRQSDGLYPIELKESNGVYYFQFPLLEKSGIVMH